MSRSGYSDECENLGLWRQAVENAIRGKRGQKFLRELIVALDTMPERRLISDTLQDETGSVCALGAVGIERGMDMRKIPYWNPESVGDAFGIAKAMAAEIEFINDEGEYYADRYETPERRWRRVRAWAVKHLRTEKGIGEE